MEMFLTVAVMSLLAVAVSAILFAAATRSGEPEATTPARLAAQEPQRFFASAPAAAAAAPAAPAGKETESVPIEALLLKIEQHIRLEQAAAESFVHAPTGASLHSRTTSRLVN